MEETFELSEAKVKQLQRMPIIETSIAKSKDGKYVIHTTRIIDIKPVDYWEKVVEGAKERTA